MNYERLNDTLDKKLIDFNFKILAFIGAILLRPLAICTEPFFRKNLGERYFNSSIVSISLVLWSIAKLLAGSCDSVLHELCVQFEWKTAATWFYESKVSSRVAWFMIFSYSAMATRNLVMAANRQSTGQVWHSMSRGESIFGPESFSRDALLGATVGAILFVLAPTAGLLFIASRIASHYLTAKQQQAVYNRYLDMMDAQIESKHLQTALDKGVPAFMTQGLYCPLPERFKGEHRTEIAKAGASAAVRILSKNPSGPDSAVAQEPPPRPAQTPQTQPVTAVQTVSSAIAKSKKKKVIAVSLLVAGVSLIAFFQIKGKQPPPPVNAESVSHPHFDPVAPTTVPRQQPAPEPISTTVAPAVPAGPSADELAKIAAERQAALEAQNLLKRQQMFARVKEYVAVQSKEIKDFQTASQSKLDGFTNKLAGIARSQRVDLSKRTEKALAVLEKIGLLQNEALKEFLELWEPKIANSDADLNEIQNQLTLLLTSMSNDRDKFANELKILEFEISKAPPKSNFLFFKFSLD